MQAGVREYWIVDPMQRRVIVYNLKKDAVSPNVYPFGDTIPVAIYEGDLVLVIDS